MVLRFLARFALAVSLCALTAVSALAQYTGGSTGTSSTGTYSTAGKSYGSGAAIGIGVGAAAAVTGIALYVHHKHSAGGTQASLVGCTQEANGATSLLSDKDKQTYSLASLSSDVKPGERVELVGKMTKDSAGKRVFQVQKLAKDYGPCNKESAQNAASPDHP